MNRHSIFLVLPFVLIVQFGFAQTNDYIKVIARAHADSTVLRWAPSSPAAWKLLIKHGYQIERYTIVRDGQALEEKPMVVLSDRILPAQPAQWQQHMENDYVAIAAQAMFGEEFKVNPDNGSLTDIYNMAQELESRYSFALFAADISVQAASLSGLRFTDPSTNPNEMYLYQVSSLVPPTMGTIESGGIYTGPSYASPLPVPPKPEVEVASENQVLIRWETAMLRNVYTSYFLERSYDDGKSYQRVNEVPMSVLQPTGEDRSTNYSTKADTVIVGKKALYRVKGWNSFGEEGPPSEALLFTGELGFKEHPTITKTSVLENQYVSLMWNFESRESQDLKGFEIERSKKSDRDFQVITKTLLPATVSAYEDRQPLSSGYYRVVAVSNKGIRNESFPYLVQLEDSIPPSPPVDLKASIDSMGVVTITWNKNEEPDLLGYRVFRSNFTTSEYGQMTNSPVLQPVYVDTVNIRTLTKSIYYKIVAVDTRYNSSDFSEVFKLELPDVVPPVPPVITKIKSEKGYVQLIWVNSSSDDVVFHRVLRRVRPEDAWEGIARIAASDTIRSFKDMVSPTTGCFYAMASEDNHGLVSELTKPLWAKAQVGPKPAIQAVVANADRKRKLVQLSWKYEVVNVDRYLIYRSLGDAPLTMYSSVDATKFVFEDQQVSTNTEYHYRIKALFEDGTESTFSKSVVVKY